MDHKCEEPLGSLSEFSFRRALAPSQWPLLLIRAPKMAVSHTNFKYLQKKHQKKAGQAWGRREKDKQLSKKHHIESLFSQLSQLRSFSSCFPTLSGLPQCRCRGGFRDRLGFLPGQQRHISDPQSTESSKFIPIHPSHRPAHRGPQVVSFETRLGQQLPPSRGEEKTSQLGSWIGLGKLGVLCYHAHIFAF